MLNNAGVIGFKVVVFPSEDINKLFIRVQYSEHWAEDT